MLTVLGEEHPDTMHVSNSLGVLYSHMGTVNSYDCIHSFDVALVVDVNVVAAAFAIVITIIIIVLSSLLSY